MQASGTRSLSVRLAADPASVPGARHFAVDGAAASGFPHLAEAAELVVGELAGNAALHRGAQFMYVTLGSHDGRLRVAVEDDGPVGPEAVSPRPIGFDGDVADWEEQATTGRGLAIVSMLAKEWGVEATARGKRVWAVLEEPDAVHEVREPVRSAADERNGDEVQLPPGWVLVRLAQCPVVLSLRQDQQLDELVRELQLLAADRDNAHSRALVADIQEVLGSPAHARLTGRRIAEEARSRGLEYVDVDMAMPPQFGPLMRKLHAAVKRADQLCEENELLTVASPPEIRELREWMAGEIIAQVEDGAPPTTWPDWLRRRTRA